MVIWIRLFLLSHVHRDCGSNISATYQHPPFSFSFSSLVFSRAGGIKGQSLIKWPCEDLGIPDMPSLPLFVSYLYTRYRLHACPNSSYSMIARLTNSHVHNSSHASKSMSSQNLKLTNQTKPQTRFSFQTETDWSLTPLGSTLPKQANVCCIQNSLHTLTHTHTVAHTNTHCRHTHSMEKRSGPPQTGASASIMPESHGHNASVCLII